jgi:hypothetical protein
VAIVVLLDKGCVANATLTLEVTTMTDEMIALRELLEKAPMRRCCGK